jgi:tripartite-type tricarboxylate transporter receptor subunit TctC
MQDLVAGQIDLMFDIAGNSLPQLRAGTIKAIAVMANSRIAAAPDIPTVDEAGLPVSICLAGTPSSRPSARQRRSLRRSMPR